MKKNLHLLFAIFLVFQYSCKHEPINFDDVGNNGGDTTNINNPGDTVVPCNPAVIYFEKDVLPILSSSCAKSGCHDAATAQDGVVLTDYQSALASGEIEPGDPQDSDLYTNLFETDPDKKMPPPSEGDITSDQKEIIRKWIEQGAKNLTCDEDTGSCVTTNVAFNSQVNPILINNCLGCHNNSVQNGGIDLDGYANVNSVAASGKLACVVTHSSGCTPMPYNLPKLDQCKVDQIVAWINEGALNN